MPGRSEHRSDRRLRRRSLVLVAAVALLAAGCGGHGSETGGGDEGAATTAAPGPTGDGAEAGVFGDMDEAVCGPGDAAGSTDQGVTDESIKIGTLSDAGNTIIPGLLKEFFESADAFVAWCNDAGGINGRTIELTKRDTKLVEGQQRIAEACTEDFMLVGGASGLDGPIVEPRVACGLPQIPGLTADTAAIEADLQVQVVPNFPDYLDVSIHKLAEDQFPGVGDHYGVLALAASGDEPGRTTTGSEGTTAIGFTTVYKGDIPPPPATVDNWRPYVESMKSAGVTILDSYIIGDQLVPVMAMMNDLQWKPEVVVGNAGQYSSALTTGNDALDDVPTWVPTYTTPFETADENQPIQQFLDLMDEANPGWSKDPKALAVQGWSAWLLFAQSAKACGSDLTRDCVMEKAAATGDWDGGGVTAPVVVTDDVSKPSGPKCIAAMRAKPDGFEYDEEFTQPNEGIFHCDEDAWAPLK